MNSATVRILLFMRLAGLALIALVAKAGGPAPDFKLPDATGKMTSLAEYKNKVILLDFWATTCGGCKQEIPWFMEFAERYRAKGLAVVGISMDVEYEDLHSDQEAWNLVNPFVKEHQVNYRMLIADKHVTGAYGVNSLPMTFLIDRSGKIAFVHSGLPKGGKDEFQREIETLLSAAK